MKYEDYAPESFGEAVIFLHRAYCHIKSREIDYSEARALTVLVDMQGECLTAMYKEAA